jgi:uncharacterized membrane protein
MKKFEKVMTTIGIVIIVWVLVSFLEVNANNKIDGGTLSSWNTFQIVATLLQKGGC